MTADLQLDPGEVHRYIAARLPKLKKVGGEYRGPCELHGGKNDNFTVNSETGQAFCHSKCGRGWDIYGLEQELTRAGFGVAKAQVFDIVGRPAPGRQDLDIERLYDYTDAAGNLIYQVARKIGKKFSQRRPDGRGGWLWNLDAVEPVPYRLPSFVNADSVCVCEGEKDADNLSRLGLTATTNSGGAGNFKPALVPHFSGKHVAIFPDNDEPGRKHAEAVAGLLAPVAASVRVVYLPDLPEKGDVSDYLASGKTVADIRGLIRSTPEWTPRAADELPIDEQVIERPGIRSIADLKPLSFYASQTINWKIPGFIAEGTLTLLSGDSGCGKTSVSDSICYAVATGGAFAGQQAQQGPVLVMDKENPPAVVVERRARLGILEHPEFRTWGGWVEDAPCDPASPILTSWVAACNPKPLIIIDSFVAFAQCDENSATEVRAFMQPLRRLADMGASIVLLHHSGKGETSKDFRGSSDIKAAVDVAYHLSNMGDTSRLSKLRLRAFKARFSVTPETVLQYVEGVGFRVDARGPWVSMDETLRALLIENPRVTASEFEVLATAKGIGNHKARQFLNTGIDSGTVRASKGPHNSKHHTWNPREAAESADPWN